ncbi:FHA domain-containing protein [Aureimonas sp. Leaf454]|uniref:FHA domain-containing protein n=1 Tax=Aureimonas sp. Leaf454 TaxID=1736381 RepID=UPI0012E3B61C|nr:FHA domain-containing protein [Aureimonas sp. Leaf454]
MFEDFSLWHLAIQAKARRTRGTLSVLVVGGGPVGLVFALQLRAELGNAVDVTVCDGRWKRASGSVAWMDEEDGVSRREQVVTLQSGVTRHLSAELSETLFPEGGYTKVWPIGGESPAVFGYPANIRILDIENRALALAVSTGIHLVPGRVDPGTLERSGHDLIVMADGPRSHSREHFADCFGRADAAPYSLHGRQVEDVVLGLRITTTMPPADQVVMTVAQQRFLMNVTDGEGYLYMRLTPNEAREVRGHGPGATAFTGCVQSNPCLMHKTVSGDFRCRRHGTVFSPAQDPASFLWPRVREGLSFFDVAEQDLHAVTAFRLSMESRPRFTAELTPTGSENAVFGALLGDAANAIHVWPGRGLNHGLLSAVSLVNALMSVDPIHGLRSADLLRHEASMHGLQHRHKDRAWRNMVVARNGATQPISEVIAAEITAPSLSRRHARDLMAKRLSGIAERLGTRLPESPNPSMLVSRLDRLNDATLSMFATVGPWETRLSGGPEFDLDLSNPRPARRGASRLAGQSATRLSAEADELHGVSEAQA